MAIHSSHYDVLVIGLGVIGASIAYHTAQCGLRTLAIDRSGIAVAPAASWASAGGVRRQGRHPAEATLATQAIARWPMLEEELQANVHYRQAGQLLFAETEAEAAQLIAFVAQQQAMGFTDVRLVDRAEAHSLVPGLHPGVLAGSYSPSDGQADAALTTRAFVQAATRHGATIWPNTAVQRLAVEAGRVIGAYTSQGLVTADWVVLAAGAWSIALAAQAEIYVPVRMVAYQMLLSSPAIPATLQPVIGSLSRALSLKQLNDGSFLIGGGHPGIVAADQLSCSVSASSKAANWQTACELLPVVAQQHLAQAWCGLEALSIDEIPLIGTTEVEGLYLAFGCSGHGFAIAPAIGQAVANELAGQPAASLAALRPERMRHYDPGTVATFLAADDAQPPG